MNNFIYLRPTKPSSWLNLRSQRVICIYKNFFKHFLLVLFYLQGIIPSKNVWGLYLFYSICIFFIFHYLDNGICKLCTKKTRTIAPISHNFTQIFLFLALFISSLFKSHFFPSTVEHLTLVHFI